MERDRKAEIPLQEEAGSPGQKVSSRTSRKREKEKKVVSEMIALYCRKNHGSGKGILCRNCQALLDYAVSRTDRCPFMESKTFCSNCRVHCYEKGRREEIRRVMRFSGPRMITVHPLMAVSHVLSSRIEKRRLEKEAGMERKDRKGKPEGREKT